MAAKKPLPRNGVGALRGILFGLVQREGMSTTTIVIH